MKSYKLWLFLMDPAFSIFSTESFNNAENNLTASLALEKDDEKLGVFTLHDELSNMDNISKDVILLETSTDPSDKVEIFQIEDNDGTKNGKLNTCMYYNHVFLFHFERRTFMEQFK